MIQKETVVYACRGHNSNEESSGVFWEKNFPPSGGIMKTEMPLRTTEKCFFSFQNFWAKFLVTAMVICCSDTTA